MAKTYLSSECYFSDSEKVLFLATAQKQIELYNTLLASLEVFEDTLNTFNGKVLNVRFKKSYDEKTAKKHAYSKLSPIEYNYSLSTNKAEFLIGFNGEEREIYIDGEFKGYLDDSSFYFDIIVDENKRVDAEKSISRLNEKISYIKKHVEELNSCIEHYDEYKQMAVELEKSINEYKSKVPMYMAMQVSVKRPYSF